MDDTTDTSDEAIWAMRLDAANRRHRRCTFLVKNQRDPDGSFATERQRAYAIRKACDSAIAEGRTLPERARTYGRSAINAFAAGDLIRAFRLILWFDVEIFDALQLTAARDNVGEWSQHDRT